MRTDAIRALATHRDPETRDRIVALLDDPDTWIAITAADALMDRPDTASSSIAALLRAVEPSRPAALRVTALTTLSRIDPDAAMAPALEMSLDTSLTVRTAAANVLSSLGSEGLPALTILSTDRNVDVRITALSALMLIADSSDTIEGRRTSRRTAMNVGDFASRVAATQTMGAWADTSDIPLLLDAYAIALGDSSSDAVYGIASTLAAIDGRGGNAWDRFFARFPASPSDVIYGIVGRAYGAKTVERWGDARPAQTSLTDADYRRIVQTLVVPAYNGAPPPRLVWETSRGALATDLNALDAPLATDNLLQLAARGAITGVRYERVIPNFVAQQGVVLINTPLQRDELSRGRLVRGNLSWGSMIARHHDQRGPGSSYDTGPAVYTFAHTPQAHNEGNFTALGRIVEGMDVVDRIEQGDHVKAVRIVRR